MSSKQVPAPVDADAPLSRDEFAAEFQRAHGRLWCIAAAVAGRQRASDIVQESALIALSKIDEFEPGTGFDRWMAQIVRYVALNETRRTARRKTSPSDPTLIDASRDAPPRERPSPVSRSGELSPDQGDFDDRVIRALDDLEETARACLLIRTVLGLPYREIARVLDIPEGTAMSHVHRARNAMRASLGGPV